MSAEQYRSTPRRWLWTWTALVRDQARVVRFLLIGLICFCLDIAVVAAAHTFVPTAVVVPLALGWCTNVGTGFLLARLLVFADGTSTNVVAGARFVTMQLVNVLIGLFGVTVLVAQGASYVSVRLGSSALLVVLNYIACRRWVFESPQRQRTDVLDPGRRLPATT